MTTEYAVRGNADVVTTLAGIQVEANRMTSYALKSINSPSICTTYPL